MASDGSAQLAEWLPAFFFEISFLEIQLWQWAALALLAVAVALVSRYLAWAAIRLVRPVVARTATIFDDRFLEIATGPLRLLIAAGLFAGGMSTLGLAIPAQGFLLAIAKILMIAAVTWLVFRIVDVSSHWISAQFEERGQMWAMTILPLGRRITKALIGSVAVLVLLQNLGVNVTALIAALGVGGIAIALAAQRTIENLFGGLTVITDQPVRVGDFCRFGDKIGTVEDINLRSTRVRTLDRTVVSVPNADFSRMELENFSVRDRIWYHPRIGLRYETSPEQLRYVLVEVRKMLYAHPKVNPDPARIRFVAFGAYSLDLDIFAYVDVTDYGEYLEVAEDLNLRIMDIVERAGSGFAFPSQTTYVEKGEGLDRERTSAAEAEVQSWRHEGQLYLPKFPPEEINRLARTLEYPPGGAPQGERLP